jgi:Protein of unknown function (DUF3800)
VYLMYIDTSGDDGWLQPNGKSTSHFYAATGLAIESSQWVNSANSLNALITKWFPDPNKRPGELHYSELNSRKGWYGTLTSVQVKAMADDVFNLILQLKPILFSILVDKFRLFNQYKRPEIPHRLAISFLIPRFDLFLKRKNDVGIMVIDSEQDKKDKKLREYVAQMREFGAIRYGEFSTTPIFFQTQFTNVLETCFFTPSQLSPMLQIADFSCLAVWNHFERAKNYRYNQIYNLYDRDQFGNVVGLKVFP